MKNLRKWLTALLIALASFYPAWELTRMILHAQKNFYPELTQNFGIELLVIWGGYLAAVTAPILFGDRT